MFTFLFVKKDNCFASKNKAKYYILNSNPKIFEFKTKFILFLEQRQMYKSDDPKKCSGSRQLIKWFY